MKKIFIVLTALIMAVVMLAGCSQNAATDPVKSDVPGGKRREILILQNRYRNLYLSHLKPHGCRNGGRLHGSGGGARISGAAFGRRHH